MPNGMYASTSARCQAISPSERPSASGRKSYCSRGNTSSSFTVFAASRSQISMKRSTSLVMVHPRRALLSRSGIDAERRSSFRRVRRLAGADFAQTSERERADGHHEITHGDVEVLSAGDENQGDRGEPGGDDISSEPGETGEHHDAGDDLDDPGDAHQHLRRHRNDPENQRTDVLIPVREEIEELVEPGEQRRQTEGDA